MTALLLNPVTLVIGLVPLLAVFTIVMASMHELSWLESMGVFYIALAIVELGHLAFLLRVASRKPWKMERTTG